MSTTCWTLDVIGDWSSFETDLNNDGQYLSANDKIIGGSFNLANEITSLTQTIAGTATTLAFTYDKAGNLREQKLSGTTAHRFTHDAWNRLVKVQHITNPGGTETVRPRGEYEYNGLSQRVVKRFDHNTRDTSNVLDEQRLMFYSAGWQLVEERIDDAWSSGHTTDRLVQHIWGLQYIDDAVLFREDVAANGSFENTYYHLTDHQFSTVALIDSAANLIERVSYTPYGEARHHWKQDVDGDGDIDAADGTLATSMIVAEYLHALSQRITKTNCAGCGYDLRGHAEQGQCPECGQAFQLANAATIMNCASVLT